MEKENSELKRRIKELEVALVPGPLFPEPLSSIQPALVLEDTQKETQSTKAHQAYCKL
jgi:hypothetical protein